MPAAREFLDQRGADQPVSPQYEFSHVSRHVFDLLQLPDAFRYFDFF